MIEDIVESVYQKADGIALGHFVWSPVPHLEEVPRVLEVERASGEEHYATKFRVVQIDGTHFRAKAKLPIAALTLHNTEELLISKSKLRPCVVVCTVNTRFTDPAIAAEVGKRKHLQDESVLLAPLYGTATPEEERGFPPKMVARIRVLLYNQFFFMPRDCPKTKLGFSKVGIARLDRIFPASRNRGIEPMKMKLSDEALALFMAVLRVRFGAAESEQLKIVRDLLAESLPEDCRPGWVPPKT